MTNSERIATAERATRVRAGFMAAAGLIIALVGFQPIEASDAGFGSGDVGWLALVALWLLVLATGGWLRLDRATRALLNDELAQANRASALRSGFFAAMLAGMILYLLSWWLPVSVREVIRMVTAAGIGIALLHYAWREWR
jgi:hypothetical protein